MHEKTFLVLMFLNMTIFGRVEQHINATRSRSHECDPSDSTFAIPDNSNKWQILCTITRQPQELFMREIVLFASSVRRAVLHDRRAAYSFRDNPFQAGQSGLSRPMCVLCGVARGIRCDDSVHRSRRADATTRRGFYCAVASDGLISSRPHSAAVYLTRCMHRVYTIYTILT